MEEIRQRLIERWPHFALLQSDVGELSESYTDVLSLERSSFDATAFWRFQFQSLVIRDHKQFDDRALYPPIDAGEAELIFIPNLLHHCRDHAGLLRQAAATGLPIYVFDALLREIHTEGHYVNYTPKGIESALQSLGYKIEWIRETGNAFEALDYMLDSFNETQPGHETLLTEEQRKWIHAMAKTEMKQPKKHWCVAWSVLAKPISPKGLQ